MDEEKKVDAVREFYKNVLGDFTIVQRLQLLSKWLGLVYLSEI